MPFSFAQDCRKVDIKYTNKAKTVKEKLFACFVKDKRNPYLVSKDCLDDKCSYLQHPERNPINLRDTMSEFGSPGFKICHKLGGQPQIFEYEDKERGWLNADRCIFKEGTFVQTNRLETIWRHFILR